MEKPAITRKLYRIAAIFYGVGLLIQCGIPSVAALIPVVSYRPSMHVNQGAVAVYLVYTLPLVLYLFLAVWLARQKEITRESTKRTAILIPVIYCAVQLLRFVIPLVAGQFLSNESLVLIRTGSSGYGLFGIFYTAGLILICCAAAIEFYRTLPAPTGGETKPLSLYAMVCAGAGVSLKCIAVFLAKLVGMAFNGDGMGVLSLPLKWKLLLIGTILLSDLPLLCAAVWFWRKPEVTRTRAKTKVILSPILYCVPALLGMLGRTLLVRAIVGDGIAIMETYGTATALVEMFSVLLLAALILICCAGAIELYMTKQTPSDGEKEETL